MALETLPRKLAEVEINAMRRAGQHPHVAQVGQIVIRRDVESTEIACVMSPRHVAQLLAVLWTCPDVHNMWGDVALVMELAAGGGLLDRLVSAGAYTEQLASTITRQVQSPGE